MNDRTKAKIKLSIAMLIFGSIGLFVKGIPLQSGAIAFIRGLIGSAFLLIMLFLAKKTVNKQAIRNNFIFLVVSGGAIGFNWIFLFEAYRFTTITKSTLSYYCAPIIVVLLSPFVLKEKFTLKKLLAVITSMFGLLLIMDIFRGKESFVGSEIKGILYGLAAATLYAFVMLINKFIKGLSDIETTMMQLMIAVLIICPYAFLKEGFSFSEMDAKAIVLLVAVGIIHTGFGYYLYFSAMKDLDASTIAIYSYIDPIAAIILSSLILKDKLGITQLIGAICILGSVAATQQKAKRERSITQN